MTISVIPEYLVLAKAPQTTPRAVILSTVYLIASETIIIFISICFLLDGFNRIRKSIKMGEVICKKNMVIALTAYSLEMVECVGFLVAASAPGYHFSESHPFF